MHRIFLKLFLKKLIMIIVSRKGILISIFYIYFNNNLILYLNRIKLFSKRNVKQQQNKEENILFYYILCSSTGVLSLAPGKCIKNNGVN